MGNQNAGGCKGVHESALRFIESGVGDPDGLRAIRGGDGLNAVGSKLLGNIWIHKGARAKLVIDQGESGIEYVDSAVRPIIGCVEHWLATVVRYGKARVGCADGRPVGRRCDSRSAGTRGGDPADRRIPSRSEEHTSELQSLRHLVCRLLLEKKKR